MIKEAYCSLEVAKLLKEKGFNIPVWTRYENEEGKNVIFGDKYDWNNSPMGQISAPTHQMTMAWLREEKNIIINVWYNGVDWDAEYYNNEDENFYLITDYSCNSYEEAVEAALNYTLENLI